MDSAIDKQYSGFQSSSIQAQRKKTSSGLLALFLAATFAMLITAGLLLLMHSLIYQEYVEPVDPPAPIDTNLVMPEAVIDEFKAEPKPEKVDDPLETPELTKFERPDFEVDPGSLLPITIKAQKLKIAPTGVNISGMLVKRVAAAPVYPRRAIAKNIEGYVDLVFDVTAFGGTENIRVSYSEPEGVFEKAAITAISKYKYQPEMSDGEPVATKNVMERIRFTIQD